MKEVQALCVVTIAKMVQAAKADQIRAHLAQLVPALLESLSGMEARRAEICGSYIPLHDHMWSPLI